MLFLKLLMIAIGSALGGVCRYLSSVYVVHRLGNDFPYATLSINIVGAFGIGFLFNLYLPSVTPLMDEWRAFAIIGFLGGFTTFSAFSLETYLLLSDGRFFLALLNVFASVALCLLATYLGSIACKSLI